MGTRVFGGSGRGRGGPHEGRHGRGSGAGDRGGECRARRGRRCRERGGRKPGAEQPSGAPRGAETRAGRGGRVRAWTGWAWGLSWARGGTPRSQPPAPPLPELGQGRWAPAEPLKFGSLRRTEFPGRESVLARRGIRWSRLAFLPLAAEPTRRRRRLANFFGRLAASQIPGGRGCLGCGPGGGRGARGGG